MILNFEGEPRADVATRQRTYDSRIFLMFVTIVEQEVWSMGSWTSASNWLEDLQADAGDGNLLGLG